MRFIGPQLRDTRRLRKFLMKRKASPMSETLSNTAKALKMAQTEGSPRAVGTGRTIHLTKRERRLKDLLVTAARRIDAEDLSAHQTREPLVLRWAGGWVRDKLLGTESHDIDTA